MDVTILIVMPILIIIAGMSYHGVRALERIATALEARNEKPEG